MIFTKRLRKNSILQLLIRLRELDWVFIALLTILALVGVLMLYSAADGQWEPWARRHAIRFLIGVGFMCVIAFTDIRFWLKNAYFLYGFALLLLLSVEILGEERNGATRWLSVGFFSFQPSEILKITLILALARYFHTISYGQITKLLWLLPPLLLVILPALLIIRQPDLGTSVLIVLSAGAVFYLAGVHIRYFLLAGFGLALAAPVFWWHILKPYQKERILTFLDPARDSLGEGYHITQSKIAFGSGGINGRGFLQGTQSQLNFLPEKQTDFIYVTLAEEFGLFGAAGLIGLYLVVFWYLMIRSMAITHSYGRLVAMGLGCVFFIYAFVNIAMVSGLFPVVGVPLPLVSYGGSSMWSLLAGFAL